MKKVFLLSLITFYVQAQTLYFNNYDSLGKNDKVVTNATFEGLATTGDVNNAVSSLVPTNRMITIGSQVGSLQTNLAFASTGAGVTEPTVTNIAQAVASAYVPTNSAEYKTTVSNATVALKLNDLGGLAVGQGSLATGLQSFSFGDSEASGDYSFGFGGYATGNGAVAFQSAVASEQLSFAIGLSASATNLKSFVYNGSSSASVYGSHGTGTFNINARNGASGIYIGETNLQSYLDRRVEKSNGTATNLSVFSSLTLFGKTITWNTSRQTFDVPLYGGVVGQLFQENLMLVRNQTGANIGNGKIVCSAGSVGDNSAIRKASSSDASCAWGVLGMVTQDAGIDHGSDGLICTGGEVNNLPLPTSVYQPSNTLWLATDGNYTNVEPQNVAVKYQIGTVLRAHATEGRIQFHPQFIPSPTSIGAASSSNATLTGTATINGDVIIGAGGVTNAILANQQLIANLETIIKDVVISTNVVRVVSTQSVYVATVTSPCVITQDVSALTLATNQTAFWTTRINVTDWRATNGITFATNIAAYAGDFTVTGCYDFACSLLCDGRIEMRQTFPTVYQWLYKLVISPLGNITLLTEDGTFANAAMASGTTTNLTIAFYHPSPRNKVIMRLLLGPYQAVTTNDISLYVNQSGVYNQARGTKIRTINTLGATDSGNVIPTDFALSEIDQSVSGRFVRIDLNRTNTIGRVDFSGMEWKSMNQLEIEAYKNGWRPQ